MRTGKVVRAKSSISIKSVAVPAEHGGWGFLSEPLLLGVLIAPSLPGIGLVLMMAAAFLLHQPLKIVVKDRRKGRVYERTRLAQRFLVIYSVIGVAGFGIVWGVHPVRCGLFRWCVLLHSRHFSLLMNFAMRGAR